MMRFRRASTFDLSPMNHRRTRRFGALVLALVQLGASTAVVAGDAILDGSQTGHATHVESNSAEACSAHHDHLFCQTVRSLANATGSVVVVREACATEVVAVAAQYRRADLVRAPLLSGTVGSRAPPLA